MHVILALSSPARYRSFTLLTLNVTVPPSLCCVTLGPWQDGDCRKVEDGVPEAEKDKCHISAIYSRKNELACKESASMATGRQVLELYFHRVIAFEIFFRNCAVMC